jgi:hypothetical protein
MAPNGRRRGRELKSKFAEIFSVSDKPINHSLPPLAQISPRRPASPLAGLALPF